MAIDESTVPGTIKLACGATAIWDTSSLIAYRCQSCFAVVGSAGQPNQCRELEQLLKVDYVDDNS